MVCLKDWGCVPYCPFCYTCRYIVAHIFGHTVPHIVIRTFPPLLPSASAVEVIGTVPPVCVSVCLSVSTWSMVTIFGTETDYDVILDEFDGQGQGHQVKKNVISRVFLYQTLVYSLTCDIMWRHGMTSWHHVTSLHDVITSHDVTTASGPREVQQPSSVFLYLFLLWTLLYAIAPKRLQKPVLGLPPWNSSEQLKHENMQSYRIQGFNNRTNSFD